MVNRYSLSDYTLQITLPSSLTYGVYTMNGTLSIGGAGENGDGSFMGSVSISRAMDAWSTEGDYTGSWVHNKNLNKTGTVALQLRQISDDVVRLMMLANVYDRDEINNRGMTLTIVKGTEVVATANDCFLKKIPDQIYGENAAMQTWEWTCGQILIDQTTAWPVTATQGE